MYTATYNGRPLYDPRDESLAVVDQSCSLSVYEPGEYRFTLPRAHPLRGRLAVMSKMGEVSLFEDGYELFRGRVKTAREAFGGSVEYVCEGERAYLNDVVLPVYSAGEDGVPDTAEGLFAWYVSRYNASVPEGQRFHVGVNEGAEIQPQAWLWRASSQRPTVWAEIKEKLVDQFGGFVRVRHEGGSRWIDWLADGTRECSQRIEFGVNLTDYMRETDGTARHTRITPWSRLEYDEPAEEGEERPEYLDITGVPDRALLEGYEKSGASVVDLAAEAEMGVVETAVEYDGVTDPETLVSNALRDIRNERFGDTLEISAVDLHKVDPDAEPIRVGDFVRVTSRPHGYDGYLLCREIEVRPSEADAVYTLGSTYDTLTGQQSARLAALNATVGAQAERAQAISQEARDAAEAAQEALTQLGDLSGTYVHIRYSESSDGSGMVEQPTALTRYIGICSSGSETAPADPSAYAWSLIRGADGVQGQPGADGTSSYLHIKWSDDGEGFTANGGETPGDWMGTCVTSEQADPADFDAYEWVKVVGERGPQGLQGLQGPRGEQGLPGQAGQDGASSYTHVAYADSADGSLNFSVSDPDRDYIGMYVDSQPNDSDDPSDYLWTRVKGEDGPQGIPGQPGADGQTPYLHIAYANSADGSQGFSVEDSDGKLYIGQCTNYDPADPSDPSFYAWTRIKGEQGEKGDTGATGPKGDKGETGATGPQGPKGDTGAAGSKGDTGATGPQGPSGVGISSTEIRYQASSDGVTPPSGTWSASIPSVAAGQYLWTRTVVRYTNNTSSTSYSVALMGRTGATGATGPQGPQGATGAAGRGIRASTITYQASSSGTTIPTGSWSSSVPSVSAGQYLWTRTVLTYTDNTSTTSYSVGRMGSNGATGPQGPQGATGPQGPQGATGAAGNGVKSAAVTYQASSSGTAVPTGTWSSSVPSVSAGQYLWTRTVTTYTNGSTTTGYSVGRMGTNGATGPQGPQGPKGDTGATGPQGPKGDKGDKGATGATGPQGPTGATGANGKMLFGTCSTAAGTAAKATTITGFSLYSGVVVCVQFSANNTAASPTLNVSGTGAKPIYTNGVRYAYWLAGATVTFVYDGANWRVCSVPVYGNTSTIGNPSAFNVYTDGDSVDVRNGTTVLSTFTANQVELGRNSQSAQILMCGGQGRASYSAGILYLSGTTGAVLRKQGDNSNGVGMNGTTAIIRGANYEMAGQLLTHAQMSSIMTGGTMLYNNASGTTGTVTLSQAVQNFNRLRIYFGYAGLRSSLEVWDPTNNNLVPLSLSYPDANGATTCWFKVRNVQISGTTVSNNSAGGYLVGNQTGCVTNAVEILIFRVVGFLV